MRNAEDACLRHGRIGQQHVFDFARADRQPGALDHLLEAAGHEEEAILVDRSYIAGAKPALWQKDCRIGIRVAEIAGEYMWTTHDDLAAVAGRDRRAIGLQDG